ncbi:23S rRNA (adenine(2503)-C(2))-methyltransferase RlmN [Buchnera aphidicola (Aphis craccivora)]|uniref:Dual-specificity RNA methyltransferase RlmN n=1 Tax=Buchnera aphidicola (Aphis craccivora) TaxID=466616 RepID=A0A4D6XRS6_9GAMM|nr:23S rRNA (adenine(2503)-C(2))-methyltransferase RlmN [Buchnera aphidicola]QCI16531.1 23S rRNA (adenine(2503)-C(2))-methyltransferase RlmN [Buchnera aphidicola (Aphis craccivora)]QLL40665.1 23S rRNA (adenine(2503)-C(2))-methyltransferase RlmN [Buchnera aphidicola (Aphis craccivore)]WAI18042.1 MAG: 23S rRNA (adenine(2503)-C(2))-methyltransferase RlmN [Buchnera aphidicola (Aphis craccivora)]
MDTNINLNVFHSKVNLLNLDPKKMQLFLTSIGAKNFAADQIMKWIYNHNCYDFNKMLNISKNIRKKLNQIAYIKISNFSEEKVSSDGTKKWITSLNEQKIETVYIPEKKRSTLCISSQIGCALKCDFCATGKQGFNRNLTTSEIISQILQAKKKLKDKKLTNIVFMGMGEPLLNLNNVIAALKIILNKNGFGLSKRRITLSTSGIIPAIDKLSQKVDVNLAISLHASNNDIRNLIMPINKKYNIELLLNSVSRYLKNSNANRNGVTIEYVMLKNINDSIKNAEELAYILKKIPSKINLIPWNSFKNSSFTSSTINRINIFANILRKKGFSTTIRKNRGEDINAACGQLTGNIINRSKNHL